MEYIVLIIVGFAAGVLGGLLGIGGSVLMIPAMIWVLGARDSQGHEMMLQYQAAAMIVNFFIALLSARGHNKADAIYKSVWKTFLPIAIISVILGVLAAKTPLFDGNGAKLLRYAFAAMMLYVTISNLLKLVIPATQDGLDEPQVNALRMWRKITVSGVFGFSAGILGIGGGAIAVPMMHSLMKMPLRNAIATSSALIIITSVIGAVIKNVTLGDNGSIMLSLQYAAILSPTAIVGGLLGSMLTHKLPLKYIRIAFVIVMSVAIWKTITA